MVAQSMLCISFTESLSPREFYLLGAARASLTPTILLTQDSNYAFNPKVPEEYQPKKVVAGDIDAVCQLLEKEISIFEEDCLELEDQEKVLRYRVALIREGREDGVYSRQARDVIFNLVAGNIG